MKKLLIFIIATFFSIGLFGQDLTKTNLRLMQMAINALKAAKADTSLSNLASVAINTHLLPGTDGAVNLGSATYKWGNIFLDSAKVINFNNGDITATHSDGTLTFAGGDLVIPDITGPTNITELSVGNSASATKVSLDSLGLVDSKIAGYIDADTTDWYITAGGRQELTDVALLLSDTLYSNNPAYYTQRQVDSLALTISASGSFLLNDTLHLHTFNAGYNTAHDTMFFESGSILGAYHTRGRDTTVVTHVISQISNDDSLTFHILYADTINAVVPTAITDTIVLNDNGTVETTTFECDTIPPDKWVYAKAISTPNGKNPIFFASTMVGKKVEGTSVDPLGLLGLCAEYLAVYNSWTNKPTGDTVKWQNTLVKTLVDAGIWAKGDIFYVLANGRKANSLKNWINPGTLDATDPGSTASPTFTAYQGYTGDGSNDYLNTTYNPSNDGINASQNSITFGAYCRTAISAANKTLIGTYDGDSEISIYPYNASSQQSCRVNDGTGLAGNVDNSQGLFVATRRAASGADAKEQYRNKTSTGSATTATTGTVNADLILLGDGSVGYFIGAQISIAFVFSALSDSEESDLYDAIQAYMTLINAEV